MRPVACLAAALTALACLCACTYRVRESNIVIPRAAPAVDLAALRAELGCYRIAEDRIAAADGASLYSLRLSRADARATVLYFGGNGYTVGRWAAATARNYARVPVNVVLVDHRGYGASGGDPTLDALLADAVLVYDRVAADPALGALPLLVHGHSLGSFMAGQVAGQRRLDGLILEATATTTEDWAAHLRSRQPLWLRMLVRRVVPEEAIAGRGNLALAPGLDEPVLYVVGSEDEVTPPHLARALFDATALPEGRKRLLVVPGGGHMDAARSPRFGAALADFIAMIAAEPAAGTSPPAVASACDNGRGGVGQAVASSRPFGAADAEESPGSTGHGAR